MAGYLAGMNVVKFLNEPTAATIANLHNNKNNIDLKKEDIFLFLIFVEKLLISLLLLQANQQNIFSNSLNKLIRIKISVNAQMKF